MMLEHRYMYQTPDSKELIPEHSLGNTGNTKICPMGRYMCYEMDKTSIFMFEILEPRGSALGKYSI